MRTVLLALYALVLLFAMPARADTAMSLYKSFTGNVNFAGTQVTIRDRGKNATACSVYGEKVAQSATLTLPSEANVVSAQLYWAGSGSADSTVTLNSKSVTAPNTRIYTSATIGGGFNYFSAAADVTDIVRLKGGGTYTFSGLQVSNGRPWCERSAVLGGYALVVVYSQKNETYRTLNLYEGFRAMLNSEVRLDMANFRVPDNVSSSSVGRFGHLVWEGDADIKQEGESLTFYNFTLTQPPYGPSGNNFNSKSSINGDTSSLGIDFDAYSMSGWPARLNSVSAVFRTGGDLVMLNAALLAVPNTPEADLSVELARTTDLRPGAIATYTATVTNKGPGTETGPFKVSLTLPAGLSYSAFSGTNWNCTGSGTSASCTYSGALENGAKAVLTLKAMVSTGATGNKTSTATVAGNNDPAADNNQSSETGIVGTTGGMSYVFTSVACKVGDLVGDGAACPLFDGPLVAGTAPTVYLTAVDGANTARALSTSKETAVDLALALGCVNPAEPGSVKASYASATVTTALPACSPDATVAASATGNSAIWASLSPSFPANTPSLPYRFSYLDAGSVKLYVSTTGSTGTRNFVQFVSMPAALKLTVTNAEGKANPGTAGLSGNGFVRAGENFTIKVEALGSGSTGVLPSFGKESGNARPVLVNSVARRDEGPRDEKSAAALEGDYPASGAFAGNGFYWSDIGTFALTVRLDKYIGEQAGAVGTQDVGRFYPAAFKTVPGPGFDCLPRMNCPAVGLAAIKTAAYSLQPFDVRVVALDQNGRQLENFDTARFPDLVPELTLAAVSQPGTGVTLRGLVDTPGRASTRPVTFALPSAFDADGGKGPWPAPTAVYLRASADDNRLGVKLGITSVQSEAAESEEGGIMVIAGRLAINNVIGSELLKTPIPMRAQYWTGRSWENNTSLEKLTVLKTDQATFSGCTSKLALRGSCDTSLVKTSDPGNLTLNGGGTRSCWRPSARGGSATSASG